MDAEGERTTADTPGTEHLTVVEAAERLGVTTDAIYKRIERGTIRYERDHAAKMTYVYLDESDVRRTRRKSADTSADTSTDELVEALREQIADLRRERDDWREQARVSDRLLAAALERIPAIEAPPEPTGAPQTPAEEETQTTGGAQEGAQRPWWRRVFGS